MTTIIKSYHNVKQIIIKENIKTWQKLLLIFPIYQTNQKRKPIKKYTGKGEKMFYNNAQEYIKELQKNSRI